MTELWTDLVACLDLDEQPPLADTAVFEGRNQKLTYHRVFGGQLLGQFTRAAALSFPDKTVKSLHVVFPREGRADEPIRYRLERAHAGRTFATATAVAEQSGKIIATASISLHAPEAGPEFDSVAPIPALPSAEHKIDGMELLPWEVRSLTDLNDPAARAPEYELWMRTPTVEPELAQAIAAYATDLTLIGTALLPVDGFDQRGNGTAFLSAVTSHTLWFHRPFRTDDWLLLRQHSPLLAHGRCFGRGDILTESGTLVASYAQEAMVRLPA